MIVALPITPRTEKANYKMSPRSNGKIKASPLVSKDFGKASLLPKHVSPRSPKVKGSKKKSPKARGSVSPKTKGDLTPSLNSPPNMKRSKGSIPRKTSQEREDTQRLTPRKPFVPFRKQSPDQTSIKSDEIIRQSEVSKKRVSIMADRESSPRMFRTGMINQQSTNQISVKSKNDLAHLATMASGFTALPKDQFHGSRNALKVSQSSKKSFKFRHPAPTMFSKRSSV